MGTDTTSVIFRIETELKTAFERIAKERDLTTSQMLRAYIREEIADEAKKNSQGDLFRPPAAPKPSGQPKPSTKTKKAPKGVGSGLLQGLIKGVK
jgi:hypothetical protein